jgi:hypothetical protein
MIRSYGAHYANERLYLNKRIGVFITAMRRISESEKISLTACKRILNRKGKKYSDEEIIQIRNWIYHVAEFTLDFVQSRSDEQLLSIKEILKSRSENKEIE